VQESNSTVTQTMAVAGQSNVQDFNQTLEATFNVTKVNPDGSVELRMQLDKIKASNRGGPGSPLASTQVRALEDLILTMTLDAKRQVVKFTGYDDLLKRVTNDDPNAAKTVRDIVKEETLRLLTQEAFGFLPDKPLNKGDKWDRKLEASLGPLGTILTTHTYTYDGPEMKDTKTLHQISVTSVVSYAPPKEKSGGFQFQITKGEVTTESATGTIWFDAEAGRLVSSESKLKLKGTLTIAVMDQNHEFKLDQEQTATIKIIPR
jgi:hypothetical protein